MLKKIFVAALYIIFFFSIVQIPFAQESEQEGSFILEEDIEKEPKIEFLEEESKPQFVTVDVITQRDVKAAISFYIRSEINKKFSGLIANLKLEKIYGILQEDKIATVYFDYSYTSARKMDKILYEKGKMTFMKFNSGKWFNAELSMYLMDSYPSVIKLERQ